MEHLPRIQYIAAHQQTPRVHDQIGRSIPILQDELSSCRCSLTSHGDLRTTRKNASQMLNSSLYVQEDLEQDNGHFSVLGSEKKWYSISENSPQGE